MRTLMVIAILVVAAGFAGLLAVKNKGLVREDALAFEQTHSNDIISRISYIRDPRTGICFAEIESRSSYGNYWTISITCVPCDAVPESLLTVGKIVGQ